ncbi:ABC transporter ATP-binding protein [Actinophytocola glycyrrhizae]|uniref:ABC transporter ATP-binding protein n=1 Tax=Actinophytocola glycyrrhizae TaxID=2044873 RepID=A0ABV9SFC6_9PSEU
MEIQVEGVCAAYGRRRVLHDVDWMVRPGVTGLLGPNGSGKTTLLSVLIGLLRPTHGSVTVHSDGASGSARLVVHGEHKNDVEDARDGTRVRFGFVPQRWSVAGHMRVVDVVAYTAWVNGMPPRECGPAAYTALQEVALTNQAKDRVRTLSGGQRQRLGIAAGLAHDPEVLVLDEPTVGLDPAQRWRVRDMVAEIGRTRTVVLSSHLLDEIAHLSDRVGVLAAGRLVFDGTVAELERHATGHGSADGGGDGDGLPGAIHGIVGGEVGAVRRSPIERGYERLLASVEAAE